MTRTAWIGAALAASLMISRSAAAADTSPPVVIGGLASQPGGAIQAIATEVSLSDDAAQITFHVAVHAGSPARLSLATPLFEWLGDAVM